MSFDELNQMFKDSPNDFLRDVSKFRTKQQTFVVVIPSGDFLELPTPTKCWQWSYFLFIDQDGPSRVTYFINNQENIDFAKGNNFAGTIVPRVQSGVPYIQKEDVFTFRNTTRSTVTILFEFNLLTERSE